MLAHALAHTRACSELHISHTLSRFPARTHARARARSRTNTRTCTHTRAHTPRGTGAQTERPSHALPALPSITTKLERPMRQQGAWRSLCVMEAKAQRDEMRWFGGRRVSSAAPDNLQRGTCCVQHATGDMQQTTSGMIRAAGTMHGVYSKQHARHAMHQHA